MVRWDVREWPRLRRSGDHLGAGVPKLSRIAFEISCSTFPTDGANCSLQNSQSQWIFGAFTSHQSAATYKTNKKTTVVFRCPSDGKVSFFWKTERRNCSYLNRECRTSFGVILFSFMEGERGSTFHGEWTISSHKGRGRWLSFREG